MLAGKIFSQEKWLEFLKSFQNEHTVYFTLNEQ